MLPRDAVDVALVDDDTVGTEEVERDRRAAPVPVARPVDGAAGVPFEWRSAASVSSRYDPSASTRACTVSIPIRSRKRRPISTAGRLRKLTVPSSKCAAPGAPGGSHAARTRRRSSRRRTRAAPACRAPRAAPGAPRRRSASRTACRTRSARSPGATATGRGGSSGRTRPRRRARPSRARGPARSSRADGGRPRSSTAPDMRTGCGSRRRAPQGSGTGGCRRRVAPGRRSARTSSLRLGRGRTRGHRSPSCGCRR